ncbi:toxin [Francisella tularensis subsp. novicida]|uniref:hypothetical protein n=1 Tax=Francisella tularensis TaxID=263 RepID=UPI0005039878|nr:hypothetical protein [Francisella tularensis]AJJ48296.1 hypothetical protein CH70_1992 [Francisella tularensis subsp. novicida]KFJ70740.1 hypothetical protein DR83_1927 [Francisella tularensis subsp. novicida]MBK2345266.1 toxin [Francisella tularensis subsp. novicida]MBK2350617.1 toxin [Francisella tularensis subsp. novicida]MBK2354176.1 toxin [Francisella tularensis subsp. novicida]
MIFRWNLEKNLKLINERGISFDAIQEAIESNGLIKVVKQARDEYKHQIIMLVVIDDYVWEVPSIVLQENPKINLSSIIISYLNSCSY